MESDLFNGTLPFPVNFTTVAIAMAVLLALVAAVRGVIGMFIGLVCLLAGAFVGYSSHSLLPGWISHVDDNPSPRFVFFVAVGIGFFTYLLLRMLAGAILISPLRKAGGGKSLVGGPVGAALSLVPAAGLILVLGVMIRLAGSLFSVEHTDAGVAVDDGQAVDERPFWARWNEAMDRDYLGALVSNLDPLAARARGAISNLLVTLKDNAAGGKLAEDPAAGNLLRSESLRELTNDPEIRRLVDDGDFIALFDHPLMRKVASNPEVAELLKGLQVEKAVDSSLFAVQDGGELVRRERRLRFAPQG